MFILNRFLYFLFSFVLILCKHCDSIVIEVNQINGINQSTLSIVDQWTNIESQLSKVSQKFVYSFLSPILNETLSTIKVNHLCKLSYGTFLQDLASLQTWAIKIFDASGKFPITGLMEGSNSHLGRYDECLSISKELTLESKSTLVKGQYCSLLVRPPLPERPKWATISNKISSLANISSAEKMIGWLGQNAHYFYYVPMRIGLCTLSTCSPHDIERITSKLLSHLNLEGQLVGNECDTMQTESSFGITQKFILVFLIGFILLVITSTLVDINQLHLIKGLTIQSIGDLKDDSTNASLPSLSSSNRSMKFIPIPSYGHHRVIRKESKFFKVIKCFSIRRNAKSILSMKENPSETLSHIHGIRVITMTWIICGHTFGLVNHTNYSQSFNSEKMYTGFIFQGLLNATVCVDTFFLMSGLLTIHSIWSKIQSHQKINPFMYTIMRYIRLTPPYIVTIGLALILPSLGQGPLWKETVNQVSTSCYSSWWTNLLYINNFIQTKNICLMHSWYLSNDFQFHIIGLIIVTILVRSTKLGFILITFLMIISTLISSWLVAINDYPPTIVSTSPATPERWNFILDYYYKPWPHVSSYLIGMIFGYLLASKRKVKLSNLTFTLVILISVSSTFVSLYGIYPWNKGQSVNPILGSLYASTFRTVWSANIGLVIFYLSQHRSSILYKCLSWKGIIPLSRLTYMAYLIHPFVIWYHYGSIREPLTGSGYFMFHNFLSFYLLTYILSFGAGLFFESPFICLIKLITSSSSSPCSSSASSQTGDKQFNDSQQHLNRKPLAKFVYSS
ncbi:nose resistant to fluoxetine protein 6-like [Panonychus citri]|uniref:nose resistant to fluoxetine protein 6-like n=1 Tax=Panonychus citri TaxID=50023 RepID=UPI0023080AE4|nr:nose resistant to fluoxetine protein 6-like [Panonychus citri]